MVRGAAGVGAATLAATATGEVLLLALLLAVVAGGRLALACLAALLAAALRAGTLSLDGITGMQAVLGPALAVGPVGPAAGSALAGVALVMAAGTPLTAVPLGLAAGLVAAGPAPASPLDLVIRLAGAIGGLGAATAYARWLAPRVPPTAALVPAGIAVLLSTL